MSRRTLLRWHPGPSPHLSAALLPFVLAANAMGLGEFLRSVTQDVSPLPRGAAPVVMIFGGLFVLATTLAIALLEPRPRASAQGSAVQAPPAPKRSRWPPASPVPAAVVRAVATSPVPSFEEGRGIGAALAPANLAALLGEGGQLGLGEPWLGSSAPGRWRFRLAKCRTCRLHPDAPRDGCAFERGFFEGGAGRFSPGATVTELRCGRGIDGVCEFELRARGG